MRSCGQVWAMGKDLEARGGRETPGHTGDESLMMNMRAMMMFLMTSTTIYNDDQYHDDHTDHDDHRPGSGGRPDEDDGFDDQYFRRRPKSFCMERGR